MYTPIASLELCPLFDRSCMYSSTYPSQFWEFSVFQGPATWKSQRLWFAGVFRSRCTVIERNLAWRGTVIEFENLRMERPILCTNFLGVECSMINGFSFPVSFSMSERIPSIMYAIEVVYSGREWCPYYASHYIANLRCLLVRDFHQHVALTHNLKLLRAI